MGKGNGNPLPLQYSFLENPRDGGVWWASTYGVACSQTLLKWLSSSSSSQYPCLGNPMDRGRLQSRGSQTVRHDWATNTFFFPVLLPTESHGQRSLKGYSPQGHKELDTTELDTLSPKREHKSLPWALGIPPRVHPQQCHFLFLVISFGCRLLLCFFFSLFICSTGSSLLCTGFL